MAFSIFCLASFFRFFGNISRTMRLTENVRTHWRSKILRSTTLIRINFLQNLTVYDQNSFQFWKSVVKILRYLVLIFFKILVSFHSSINIFPFHIKNWGFNHLSPRPPTIKTFLFTQFKCKYSFDFLKFTFLGA